MTGERSCGNDRATRARGNDGGRSCGNDRVTRARGNDGGRNCGNDRVTRARRARVAGMSGGSVWGRRGEAAGKSRRAGRRGQERMKNRGKASVPSDLAHPARRRFVERPRRSSGPDPAAPRVPRLRAPVRGTFAEARTPRSSRFGGQPAVASRAACRSRRRAIRLASPPSRSRPGIPGRETQVPRSVRAPRYDPPDAAPLAACANRPRPAQRLFASPRRYSPFRSDRLRRSSGAPPG